MRYEHTSNMRDWAMAVLRPFMCLFRICIHKYTKSDFFPWLDGFKMRVRLMHKMHVAVRRTLWLVFILTSHTHTLSLSRIQPMHLTCFFHLPLSVLPFSSAFFDSLWRSLLLPLPRYFVHDMSLFGVTRPVNSEFYYIFEYFPLLLICNECHRCRF